jgi:ketosteroid isomerase-like protein
MTTHPNAHRLRDAYQAVGQGDLQPMLALLREDATWTDSTLGPLAGTYGNGQVTQFFAAMMEVYRGTLQVEIASIIADDDHGVVLTRESGTVDGEQVAWTSVHVYSFDHGRVRSFVSYGSAEYQRFWSGKRAALVAG